MVDDAPTIMIVDDQNTSTLEALLAADGYQVVTADNGLAALNLLGEHQVDLMLLDIAMPGMDGYEVLRRIRGQPNGEQLPILLCSARYTESGDAAHGLRLGADDYISKPFEDLAELKARIAAKLRQRRLEAELREARRAADAQSHLLRRTLDILQTASRSLDPDSLTTTIYRELQNRLEIDRAAIWRRRTTGEPYAIPEDAPPFPETVWQAVSEGAPIVQERERMILPMRIAGQLEGVLDVERCQGWPDEADTILQALADSLAILFQNTFYVRQIARENTLHELLNRLSAQEATLDEMLRELRQFIGTRLLLVDRWFNLMASEPVEEMVQGDQLRPAILEHYHAKRLVEQISWRRRTVTVEAQDVIPFHRIFPVMLGGEVTALLISVPVPDSVIDSLMQEGELERVARFLAGVLQRRRENALREQSLRADFLSNFLAGRLTDDMSRPTLFLRANALGLNLAQPGCVAQLELPNFDQLVDWTQRQFEQRVGELLAPLLRDAQRAREIYKLDGIEVTIRQRVVVVLSLPVQTTEAQAQEKITAWAEEILAAHERRKGPESTRPAIGLGRLAHSWQELPRSADEADRALRWALSNSRKNLAYYGNLGSERLLAAINDNKELERFCQEQLGPIIKYDRERDGDLIRTLDMFFANGGQMARAAQLLAVHPNTLKYRLDQIAQLTGRDPRDPAVALDLQLALKIHGMI